MYIWGFSLQFGKGFFRLSKVFRFWFILGKIAKIFDINQQKQEKQQNLKKMY